MVDEPLLEIGGKIDALNKELGAVGQAEIDLPGVNEIPSMRGRASKMRQSNSGLKGTRRCWRVILPIWR